MSSPYALPDGPTRFAESSTSMPPPEPRSSTTSPGDNCASAVGFPQPSEAVTASCGKAAFSLSAYRLEVMGSAQPVDAWLPQQPLPPPVCDRRAASAYFRCTTCLMSSAPISSSVFVNPLPPLLLLRRAAQAGERTRLDRSASRAA